MKFTYQGPVTGLNLPEQEVVLISGMAFELPEDNEQVKMLVGLGHLTPQPELKPAKQKEIANAS